jgi:hypothetical protein
MGRADPASEHTWLLVLQLHIATQAACWYSINEAKRSPKRHKKLENK